MMKGFWTAVATTMALMTHSPALASSRYAPIQQKATAQAPAKALLPGLKIEKVSVSSQEILVEGSDANDIHYTLLRTIDAAPKGKLSLGKCYRILIQREGYNSAQISVLDKSCIVMAITGFGDGISPSDAKDPVLDIGIQVYTPNGKTPVQAGKFDTKTGTFLELTTVPVPEIMPPQQIEGVCSALKKLSREAFYFKRSSGDFPIQDKILSLQTPGKRTESSLKADIASRLLQLCGAHPASAVKLHNADTADTLRL